MKKINFILILLFSVFAFSQDWESSYEKAITSSKETGKPVILVFAGSDWCASCIKLEREIWKTSEFISYAKENYILYKADFPRKKTNKLSKEKEKQNAKLAEKYNPKGYFPLVVVLNKEGKSLGKIGYKKVAPSIYISLLNSFVN
ncbi:MAG: thioredoxin family protein [Cellulophaga sp.]